MQRSSVYLRCGQCVLQHARTERFEVGDGETKWLKPRIDSLGKGFAVKYNMLSTLTGQMTSAPKSDNGRADAEVAWRLESSADDNHATEVVTDLRQDVGTEGKSRL